MQTVGESPADGRAGSRWEPGTSPAFNPLRATSNDVADMTAGWRDGRSGEMRRNPSPAYEWAFNEVRSSRNRPAYGEPGGCECMTCGAIFIGAEWHTKCGVCASSSTEE